MQIATLFYTRRAVAGLLKRYEITYFLCIFCLSLSLFLSLSLSLSFTHCSQNELTKLLSDGVTSVLSGFTSKAGKKFAARLALNEKNQVMFVFPDRFTNSEEGGTSSDE